MATQFRDSFYQFVPPWLQTGAAEKYLYTLELARDCLVEKANEAVKFRLPGQGDVSQIPYLAFDRVLVQGPGEPNASFVGRLQGAFAAWGEAGSAPAVLYQLQAYMQNLQSGVPGAYPQLAIVSNRRVEGDPASTPVTTWNVLYQGAALGSAPVLASVPFNFNWDGASAQTWRAWLIVYLASVATGQSGVSAQITTAGGGSFTSPGQNVGGVWVPTTSGTPVNAPFLTLTGLTGLSSSNVGELLTLSGSTHSGNNGSFLISQVLSSTSCVIANALGVASDAGPLTWSISRYPWIGPGPAWGTPGVVWGQGQSIVPVADTGSNIGGVWQPSATVAAGTNGTISWGLDVGADVVETIRQIVQAWKSGGTYYPNIILAFDGGNGASGSAYSPYSSAGAGNPDGTFGSVGKNTSGVWGPTRKIASGFDAFCQGTGVARDCSVENIT